MAVEEACDVAWDSQRCGIGRVSPRYLATSTIAMMLINRAARELPKFGPCKYERTKT